MSQPAKQAGEESGTSFALFADGRAMQQAKRACFHANDVSTS